MADFNLSLPSSPRRLVLASTSKYRQQLLRRLAVPFEACDPGVDEDAFKGAGLPPDRLVLTLAQAKAQACLARFSDAVVIGGDQCAEVDGAMLGKPGTIEACVDQLMLLSGRTHRLLTAVCVIDGATGSVQTHLDEHRLTMRKLTAQQARFYAEHDRALDCAGGYKIESLGVALFTQVDGHDATAIMGLPLIRVSEMLRSAGIDVLGHG